MTNDNKKQKSLTQDDLSDCIKTDLGVSKDNSMKLVKNFFSVLESELKNGSDVKLLRFGSFKKVRSSGRVAMDFRTRERVNIDGRDGIKFVPSNSFKAKVRKSHQDSSS